MTTRGERVALSIAAAIPLAFLAVFFVLPLVGMLARGLAPDGSVDWSGLTEVFGRSRTVRVLWFTAALAVGATLVTVLLGIPLAHVVHRLAIPGQRFVRVFVVAPFVLPTVVVGVAFRSLVSETGWLGGLGLDGSWVTIVAACVFFNLAVVVRTVGGVWDSLDLRSADAAATLGASPWRVWWDVTWPALRPGVVSAASVVFLYCSTAFGVVLVLGGMRYSTIESEIYLLTTKLLDLPGAAALSILQLVTVLILLLVVDRSRLRARAATSSGRVSRRTPITVRSVPVLLVALVSVVLIALPMASLVVRAFQRGGEITTANFTALGTAGSGNALTVSVWSALGNSWRIALYATALAVALGVCISVVVSRRPRSSRGRRGVRILDGIFMIPLGVSAVTIGFGYLITLDRPPLNLRSSPVLVPIAQALVALPLVVRILVPVLRGIDDRQRQAAATLGAGPWRRWATVDFAALRRPLLAAAGFAAAISLGEFGATSFLARTEEPTLPVVIYRLLSRPGGDNFGMALAASVVLAGTTVLVMWIVERIDGRSVGRW